MAFIEWQPSFSVKVPELDQQHQRLVGMLNRMHEALHAGGDAAEAEKVLEDLGVYTRHHFTTEERLMEQCGYPELEEHRRKHRAMERQVMVFREQIGGGGVSAQLKLMSFLRDWLQKHILETDMRYSEHLSQRLGR